MLEGAYEACLIHELADNGFDVQSQLTLPIRYRGLRIDAGYRLDLLVNECVIVELKAIERLLPVHEAQLLSYFSYLRMSNLRLGLLINFNVKRLVDGVPVTQIEKVNRGPYAARTCIRYPAHDLRFEV